MYEQIGEILSEMIKIPTVSGKGNEEQYQIDQYKEYLWKTFDTLFNTAEVIPVGDALLLKLNGVGDGKKPVLFTGHMDVVPAEADTWIHNPFSGFIEEGRVWGRGSQDMKGPQCALLSAADHLLKEGWEPKRDIWFYLSCDEETGGYTTDQAAKLLELRNVQFETVFDEGGTICEDFMGLINGKAALFGIAEKGSLQYRFTAYGKGGHAANPPRNSPVVRLAKMICEIEEKDIFIRRLSNGNREMLRKIAVTVEKEKRHLMELAAEEKAEGYPVLHEICSQADQILGATIAFTMAEGGSAFNVMPKCVSVTANVRVSSVEREIQITKKLKDIAEKYEVVCDLISGQDASPEGEVTGKGYCAMSASVGEIYPDLNIIPFVLGGGTDSRHFQHLTEEVLRFSPMYAAPHQGRGVHGENESAYISAVMDAARCYEVLLKKYL